MFEHYRRPMSPRLSRRLLIVGLLAAGVACAAPTAASAQATRTWVSGVGDDANPCSRTAPCKTFAGAISKTAARGEINTLDPGGFGAVTITKSIAIRSKQDGGILSTATNGIIINAAATDRVILSGLEIEGAGTGLTGVRILQARDVKIFNSEFNGFTRSAIDFEPSNGTASAPARLHVQDTILTNSGPPTGGFDADGIQIQPSGTGNARASIVRTTVAGFDSGVIARGAARADIDNSTFVQNANVGVFASGPSAQIRVGRSQITDNLFGIGTSNGGSIFSFGNNQIAGNGTDGTPTSTVAPKR